MAITARPFTKEAEQIIRDTTGGAAREKMDETNWLGHGIAMRDASCAEPGVRLHYP